MTDINDNFWEEFTKNHQQMEAEYLQSGAAIEAEKEMNYWRLCDSFTVEQAALLIAGVNPSKANVRSVKFLNENLMYRAAHSALTNAILNETLKATIIYYDEYPDAMDPGQTRIDENDLETWLATRKVAVHFFEAAQETPGYLDPNHPRYAPKLAAAINAWLAVGEPKGKSPKQALDKWLRENAAKYGLTDDDGNPVNQAIEDISKVANWKTKGGASKTPG